MTLIADGFIQQAQQRPHHPAVQIRSARSSHTCSYGDLLTAAQQVAGAIENECTKASPLVGLWLPNSLEFVEIFLGVALSAGVSLVFDPQWTVGAMQQVCQHPLDLLFVDATLEPKLAEVCHTIPAVKPIVVPSGRASVDRGNYVHWRNSLGLEPSTVPGIISSDRSDAGPFYIGFTSGTTSIPKGVIRSHRSWVQSFAASQVEFGTSAADRLLVPGALVHSLSLFATLEGLNAGATVTLLPKFNARVVLECLQTDEVTTLVAVPTLLKTIAKAAQTKGQTYPHLQRIIAGGSKLDPTLRNELPHVFPKAEILEYLGAIELSFIALASSREPVPANSIGRPFHGVAVSIQRTDGSGEAAIGEVGLISVKSAMLSCGYWNAEATREPDGLRFVNGWATVGDLGWRDANGYLYLAGREQDMIITGGMNVYPLEVEQVLQSLPEVEEAAVFGMADADRGQTLCAAIRWAAAWLDRPLTRLQLQQRLQAQLPLSKCPRHIFTVDRFPLTTSGKINRVALRDELLATATKSSEAIVGE
jgi:acyl-CoA synthetase (AMP-forming)/AMP-acid ligase II